MRPEERRKLDPTDGRLSRHFLSAQNPRAVFPLTLRVIEAPRQTRLVTSVRRAPALDPRPETTPPSAVPVPAETPLADREGRPAPPARQQVQDEPSEEPLAQNTPPSDDWTSGPQRCDASPSHPLFTHPPR